jgi:hypothetical protein
MQLTQIHPENANAEVATADLPQGAQLFIWSVRRWVFSALRGRCVRRDLADPYHRLTCLHAIPDLDQFMSILSQRAKRAVAIRCCPYPYLSNDERTLLRIMQAQQSYRDRDTALAAARTLAEEPVDVLIQAAGVYYRELQAVGMKLSTWRELRVVEEANV